MAEESESVKGLTVKESTIHEEADRILNKVSIPHTADEHTPV